MAKRSESFYSRVVKRTVDLTAVIIASPLWLAAMALMMALVRLTMGKPVFFRQHRGGLGGRVFTIYKIRTMRQGEGEDSTRLTVIGRFLRATSLDELPQMINVLRGDMSFIGPRPLLATYLPLYSPRHARRHEVRPGITGWAQVNGRNLLSWEQKFDYDVEYVDSVSAFFDMKIAVKTIWSVISGRGVSPADSETPKPFEGYDASTADEKQ